jgi:uncharacterized protein involved in outer membrane biogenesis
VRRWLLLLLPLAIVVLGGLVVLALPSYLASATHRPTVEALASSLTGRDVKIAGPLSVTLFPSPEVTADDVTITGPAGETIQTDALTLDLSGSALLHGRLTAQTLSLNDPVIRMPWPLPGGAAGISPPGWLATLHAAIVNGSLSLGNLSATGVNAEIYTDDGAVTLSGSGQFGGDPATVSLALQRAGDDGAAPLSIDAKTRTATLHLTGALSAASTLTGSLAFSAGDVSLQAPVMADAQALSTTALTLRRGATSLTGSATLTFAPPHLQADLAGNDVDLSQLPTSAAWPVPATIVLSLTQARLFGHSVPAASLTLHLAGDGGAELDPLTLTLPGQAQVTATIARRAGGAYTGAAHLSARDLVALLAAYGLPPVPDWTTADISATLGGAQGALSLTALQGTLGADHVAGTLVLSQNRLRGALALSHVDLLALAPWLTPRRGQIQADGEITAASARLGPLALTDVLIDGVVGDRLNLRRFSARLAHGMVAGNLAVQGALVQGSLLASAASGAALAPVIASLTGWAPPPALLSPRLTINAAALGTAASLSTSAVATLGDFTLTAAPLLDLDQGSGAGALTLRHPNAIRALSIFNLNRGLDWPGPGALSLRANAVYDAKTQGLSDAVLTLGRLTASGRVVQQDGRMNGNVIADNLDLPPWPKHMAIPWPMIAPAQGTLRIKAATLSLERQALLSPLDLIITAAPGQLTAQLNPSGLAGGTAQGTATATTATTAPPALLASLKLDNIDAAQLQMPAHAPVSLASGTLQGTANLTAAGYSPTTWQDTLGGTISITAANGSLTGLSLPGLLTALTTTKPNSTTRQTAIKAALTTGATPFTTADLTTTLADGAASITAATLASPAGTITATGIANLPDRHVNLHLTITPLNGPALARDVSE